MKCLYRLGQIKEHLLNYGPVYMIMAVAIVFTILYVVSVNQRLGQIDTSEPSAYDHIKACIETEGCTVTPPPKDTRSEKEKCLDDARNMWQSWRCKRI